MSTPEVLDGYGGVPLAIDIAVRLESKNQLEQFIAIDDRQTKNINDLIQWKFDRYETELKTALRLTDNDPSISPFTHYPVLKVLIDADEYEVVFDFELLVSLLVIYVNTGWSGLWKVEQTLSAKCSEAAKQRLSPGSGGVYVEDAAQWVPVQSYFLYVRNLLAILIRNALASIEKKASDVLVLRLNYARNEAANIWKEFGFAREIIEADDADDQGRVSKSTYEKYSADKKKLESLYLDVHDIYLQSVQLEKVTDRLNLVNAEISTTKYHIRGSRTRFQPTRLKKYKDRLKDLQLKQSELAKLIAGLKEFLNASTESAIKDNPASLLVLGSINNIYNLNALEQVLGKVLWQFISDVESDAAKSSKSVNCNFKPVEGDLKDPKMVQGYASVINSDGIEGYVIDAAIDMLDGNLLLYGLLCEDILDSLIEQESINKESLEYIVCIKYQSILPIKLDAAEESKDKFLKAISTISAALSVATLLIPETAPVSGLLRGVSLGVNAFVLAHHYQNIAKRYAMLSQRVSELLVKDSAVGPDVLARIGELAIMRKDIMKELTMEALLPIVMTSAERFRSIKTLLRDYALVMDVLTLTDVVATQ